MHPCHFCNCTEFTSLGKLGNHEYFKCRDCGIEFSNFIEDEEHVQSWEESWEESYEDDEYLDRFADAEVLASAGFGTDEDYGHFGGDD